MSNPYSLTRTPHRSCLLTALLTAALATTPSLAQTCSPEWMTGNLGVPGTTGIINAFLIHDDGINGAQLYASGIFTSIGGLATGSIARWDGAQWNALGPGLSSRVTGLATFDDGTGPALYASGNFSMVGGTPMAAIARWDGQNWSPLGAGLTRTQGAAAGFTLAAFEDGLAPLGRSLYVGGSFEFAGGQPAVNIARWDGQNWHSIGDASGTVNRLYVWDDGAGEDLYAGGNLVTIGGISAGGIARWNGSAWSSLGGGLSGGLGRVNAIQAYDDGTGEALFVGGDFTTLNNPPFPPLPASNFARWNGNQWSSPAGGGVSGGLASIMSVFDDGQGPALFVGGSFTDAGGVAANRIARWTSSGWSEVPGGLTSSGLATVTAMAVHDDGSGIGPALYIGGGFQEAGNQPAFSLTRWGCAAVCYANCDGSTVSPILNVDDFTCFINEFAAAQTLPHEQQITAYANCDNSTIAPALNVDDFTCFINEFAAGCE